MLEKEDKEKALEYVKNWFKEHIESNNIHFYLIEKPDIFIDVNYHVYDDNYYLDEWGNLEFNVDAVAESFNFWDSIIITHFKDCLISQEKTNVACMRLNVAKILELIEKEKE